VAVAVVAVVVVVVVVIVIVVEEVVLAVSKEKERKKWVLFDWQCGISFIKYSIRNETMLLLPHRRHVNI
jgi:steroid 5-alpha reductase family enzyme